MRSIRLLSLCAGMFLGSAAMASETINYTYDQLGRLTQVAHSGTVNNGLTRSFTLDATDNRTNVTVIGSPNSTPPRTIPLPAEQRPAPR